MTAPVTQAPAPLTPTGPPRGTPELITIADLGDEARAVVEGVQPPPSPKRFVGMLMERGLHLDAVKFLAHALPRREAVWWVWVCARKASGPAPKPAIKDALDATERWIVQPTDERRRQALTFGETADFGTAAGCAALAAFMSGGSLAPPEAPPVPPGEFLTAKAVSGGVILSAVATEPDKAPEKYQEFVKLGIEVAERTKLWPTET
jgi:Family of unknown function (DUF6931)